LPRQPVTEIPSCSDELLRLFDSWSEQDSLGNITMDT